MGASIKQFCKIFNMGRFACHRHLIEKFGAKSPLGIMVTRLLKTKNETEYFQLCSEISVELKMYEQLKEKLNRNDEKKKKKIKNLRIMISGIKSDSNSNYNVFKWTSWLRIEYHMGRCSNHAEGAHGNINESTERRGAANFSTGLSATINYILNNIQNRKANISNFSKNYSKLKRKIIDYLTNSKESDIQNHITKDCKCENEEYNKSLYGVSFPCYHKLIKSIYLSREYCEFKKINHINIECFIINFLQMKTNISRKYNDKEIETKCDEIIEYYNSNKNIHLDKKTTTMFVKYLFSVFSYELPSPLEFNENCDVNIFHIEETEPIEIKKPGKPKFTPKAKVNNNDLCFWTRNCKIT